MFINGVNFDNTLSVRKFAQTAEAEALLNIPQGTEKQLYSIGAVVDGTGYGFNKGIIINCYNQNDYFWYDIEYKLKPTARKKFKITLRQKDIIVSE